MLRFSLLALLWLHIGSATAQAPPRDASQSPIWLRLQGSVFDNRPIQTGSNAIVQLHLNARADDAASVPILVRMKTPQATANYVKRVWLVIDDNPSPVGATFHFTPESGQADIETRVRIEQPTFVRAIAETSRGELFMDVKPIDAAGGCSGASAAGAAAMAHLGKMRMRLEQRPEFNKPVQARLMVSHPNFSGLSKNDKRVQYVKRISVTYAEREILSADIDFTISENPTFRFYLQAKRKGELKASAVDSNELKFETTLAIEPES